MANLKQDILHAQAPFKHVVSVNELTSHYNSILSNLVEKHAPLISKSIISKPHAPWSTVDLARVKRERRRLERVWHLSKDPRDHQIYKQKCASMNKLIQQTTRPRGLMLTCERTHLLFDLI